MTLLLFGAGKFWAGTFDICDLMKVVFDCEDFAASLIEIVEVFGEGWAIDI